MAPVRGSVSSRYPVSGPTVPVEPIGRCPLCGGTESRDFAHGYDYELETCSNQWRLVQCEQCDHVWLDPRPRVDALGAIYPASYYAYNYAAQIHPLAAKGKQWLDRRKLDGLLRHLRRAPTSYLDVGCGEGRFLRAMEARGLSRDRLYGLELDERVAAGLRGEGFRVERARVEDSTIVKPNSVDLITMFHVIEHVDDPVAVVKRLAGWMAPGGLLGVETPNRASLDARLFRRTYWGGYHFPRHWNLFDTAGVRRLVEGAGLEVVRVDYQTGHSFWLYSFHHALKYGRISLPWLARRFDPLGSLIPLLMVTGWDKLRGFLGFPTSSVLLLARKPS